MSERLTDEDIKALERLHRPIGVDDEGYPVESGDIPSAHVYCDACSEWDQDDGQQRGIATEWPCPTRRLLDAHARLLAERNRLQIMLAAIYGCYEDGTPCYEDADTEKAFLGNAVRLTEDEENEIIALLSNVPRPSRAAAAEAEVERLRDELKEENALMLERMKIINDRSNVLISYYDSHNRLPSGVWTTCYCGLCKNARDMMPGLHSQLAALPAASADAQEGHDGWG